MYTLFLLLAVVLVTVQLLIVASSYRAQRERSEQLPLRKRVTELLWALAPMLVLVVLLLLTARAMNIP